MLFVFPQGLGRSCCGSCHGPFGPDLRIKDLPVMPTPASVVEGFEGFGAEIS